MTSSEAGATVNITELQETVVELRMNAPEYIENAYKKINVHKLNALEKTKYQTDVDDFRIPQIINPFALCKAEDITITKEDTMEQTLKTQVTMMQVLLFKLKLSDRDNRRRDK